MSKFCTPASSCGIGNKGQTPLMRAILARDHDLIRTICFTAGCGINAQDQNGDTAMHMATRLHDEVSINILADYLACTTIVNNVGDKSTDIAQLYPDWSREMQEFWEICSMDTDDDLSSSDVEMS